MTEWSEHHPSFHKLLDILARIPAIQVNETPSRGFGSRMEDGGWWIKLSLATDHPLAWNAVQELGYVLNYLSASERLPTVFKPVSPPPYLNGGPHDFLAWVIECYDAGMEPDTIADWLEGRMPRPVEDAAMWVVED